MPRGTSSSMPEGTSIDPARLEGAERVGRLRRRRQVRRLFLLVAVPLLVVAGALHLYLQGGRWVSTDNAYVRAGKVTISTDVSGIVAAVLVAENQVVAAGAPLFRFDDEPFRIAVAGAEAALGTVLNELATLKANHRQRLEEIGLAEADLAYQERDLRRQMELGQRGVAALSVLDLSRVAHARARQRLAAAREEAAAVLAALGGSADAAPADHPRARQAQAALDKARRELKRTTVFAPVAGIVVNVTSLQPGEYLEAGKPAFSLVATDQVWVDANPKETDLTHVRVGNPATVRIDTYPDREWHGRVASFSPASGAEFALLPPQNASGNWIKVVQRIPVRIDLDGLSDGPALRSGMSVVVEIDTGRQRSFATLREDLERWLGIGR
ncbi:MAG: HlyD family secretion protein [Alphaproteobacteria bacterium]|nr:HlyD family secretion protein [Alphaproteobacteria bacterium]